MRSSVRDVFHEAWFCRDAAWHGEQVKFKPGLHPVFIAAMTKGAEMSIDAPSARRGGAGVQQPDSAITDANALANFLEIAHCWSARHLGGASLYSGVDSLGTPFLVALENDGHQAELFRRDTFDTFELTTSADGQQRKNWVDHAHD